MMADELIVDSFAGGGGASLGIEWATGRSPDIAINHDRQAIAMHIANHPRTVHLREDVWRVDPREATRGRPVGLMWLSPDCRHFSKAKGGSPVSPRVRGLAWVAVHWARAVRPRVIVLENVEEFQSWGPVVDGRPCAARKGQTFLAFLRRLRNLGYDVEWRELRACDYGAPTIRRRLFLVARCDGQPIRWPAPTHGRGCGQPWRAAAECMDWSIPCPSIFRRKRPLRDATLRRIARGIMRYVVDHPHPFIVPATHGGDDRIHSASEPLRTVTCAPRGEFALIAAFLAKHYGERNPSDVHAASLFEPAPTVTSIDHNALVAAHLVKLKGTSRDGQSIQEPLHTVAAGGTHHAEVRAFLVAYYGNDKDGGTLIDPIRTLSTRDRFGLVVVDGVDYAIVDIGMRMLSPRELYRAQGFPDSYRIDVECDGKALTRTAQVRMCGNSVCPPIASAIVLANVADAAQPAAGCGSVAR